MKKILVLIILFIVSSVTASCSEDTSETPWKKVTDNNYIYEDGIVGTEEIYGFTFLLKSYNKGQYEAVNGKNIWYTLSQYTINCGEMTYKIGVMDSYSYQDRFIFGDYNKYAAYQPIVSGTAISAVANKLCRF